MEQLELDNYTVGQNIAKFRKASGLKAFDVATQLGMKENTYTKYERGETAITIDFVKKVAEIIHAEPFQLLSTSLGNFFNINSNSQSFINANNNHTSNDQQTMLMLELIKSMLALNERIVALLEAKGGDS